MLHQAIMERQPGEVAAETVAAVVVDEVVAAVKGIRLNGKMVA